MSFFARSVYGCMGVCVRVIHAISPFLSPGSRPFGKFSFWRWVFLVMGPLLANAKKHNKRNYLRSTRFFLCHHLVVFFPRFVRLVLLSQLVVSVSTEFHQRAQNYTTMWLVSQTQNEWREKVMWTVQKVRALRNWWRWANSFSRIRVPASVKELQQVRKGEREREMHKKRA